MIVNDNYLNSMKLQSKDFNNLNPKNTEDKVLRKVSDDFETFFSQQLLDISLKSTKMAGGGTGSDIVKGMYTEALAKTTGGTFGISDILYKFLSESNK
jgi:Rod binding domain-containing protein